VSQKSAHDVHELGRDLVAQIVLVQAFAAEIQRGSVVGAGHDVPTRPSTAQMVERRKGASDLKRLAEAGRDGGAEPDVTRHHADRRE